MNITLEQHQYQNLKEHYKVRTREEIEIIAASQGVVCIWPTEFELALDIDIDEPQRESPKRISVNGLLGEYGISDLNTLHTTSPGGGTHIYYPLLKPVTPLEAAVLQACLGSDPLKEALTVLGHPTAMFETAAEAAKVEAWRKEIHDRQTTS